MEEEISIKMNEAGLLHENKYCDEEDDDTTTPQSLIKKRSFDLNKEFRKRIPLRKTKSLSSQFLINIDELVNYVDDSFNEIKLIPKNSSNNDEMIMRSINEKSGSSEEDLDSCSWRKTQIDPAFGIYLKFEDISLKGINSDVGKCILQGVSGSVFPGEMLALMGPSGGGKTTLLNILSGRVKNNGGTITYNDRLYTKSLKRRIGFVLQDDVVFPHLTVKETLTYSALLRLPNTLSRKQKKERTMNVIFELGLEKCQDTMIGGKFVRGISGGERKRVCIGNEILMDPSLLFLDEPTSSLDSTTALVIIQMLHNIAQAGKTVVTTIHQPSSRLFSKFDRLILLGRGCSLYFGKASEAMLYFSSIGCSPLIAMNPAEFLIDLANGNLKDKSIPINFQYKDGGDASSCDVHEYFLGAYESGKSEMEKIQIIKYKFERKNEEEWGATWSEQFSILLKRGLKERRHEYLSSLRIIQVISTAIVIGLLWWHSDASSTEKFQDQAGLLFFISVFWTFFPLYTAIFTFPQEREMLAKERSVDMYKLSAYLTARNISDLPLDLLLPVLFLVIVYFMVGLKPTFPAFLLTLLTIFLSIIASQGLGLTIGAAFMDIKQATTLAAVIIMTFMLTGGLFVEKVPPLVSWIKYISLNYHTYKLLLKIQYSCNGELIEPIVCEAHSKRLDYGGLTEVGAMLIMIIIYRIITYLVLRRMKLRT